MAGEWIKVEASTAEKPEVLRIARILKIDRDSVFGKLIRLWSWIDTNSVDGAVDGVVDDDIDQLCHCPGFAAACVAVGWLTCDSATERVVLPNFDRHNGETAKHRSLKSRRQAKWRAGAGDHVDGDASTSATTREEKRREEKNKSKIKNKARASPAAQTLLPVDPIPGWMPVAAWAEWLKFRSRKKGGYSDYARTLAIRSLTTLRDSGHDPDAVINQSIENGWPGLYPIKPGASGVPQAAPSKTLTAIQLLQAKVHGISDSRDRQRVEQAHVFELGSDASGRHD